MRTPFKSLALAALVATMGFAAYAQSPTMMGDHNAMMGEGRMHKMDPAKMDAMVTKHHAALKAKLKITPAQEPAWTTFTDAMKPNAKMHENRPDRAELAKLTTPERIDKMKALRTQHMTDMNAAMDKRDQATKTLYAALSPEQQKVFDSEHARMGKQRR
jgi:protein CpxP